MTSRTSDSGSSSKNNNNGSSSGGRDGVAHGFGKDPPPSNPFGNYSFMEAQQQSSGASGNINNSSSNSNAGALGAGEQQLLRHSSAPAKENNPFLNYSFMEAQQQQKQQPFRSSTAAPEPSSPITAGAGPGTGTGFSQAHNTDRAEATEGLELVSTEQQQQQGATSEAQQESAGGRYGAESTSIEQQAIRMMYEEFRRRAAAKIDAIVELRHDREPDLARYLEQGADRTLDRTLEKLGNLARRRPRVIIELLLVWRKTTIDAADDYPLDGLNTLEPGNKHGSYQTALLPRSRYVVKERRSLVSVYILCRALSAVVSQLDASHLEGDLGDRLEELVFSQVKQVNTANLRKSQNRREIQDLYARLIGRISEIRFASMSDRFIAELERIPMVSGSGDERIVILLHNMRFLRLRVYPIDALEESSAFLLSCAKFYSRTTGSLRLKHAWATLLTELLMPMAAVVDVEVNLPELVQAIDIIYTKAMKMAAKVRHVTVAFPLAAATLCISRRETFHQRWLSLLEFCIQRLKDKQFRHVSMDAILRMLWVYLFRYPEAASVVLRRIDSLSRIFFPATKLHAWPKTVPHAAFEYFLVCAACYNFDFTMRQLLQGMLQIDSGWPGTTRDIADAAPILDTLNPARVAIAFQALVGVAAIAATSAGDGEYDAAAGDKTPALRPPFPGVAQLSGLDCFSVVAATRTGLSSADAVSGIGVSALGSRCESGAKGGAASAAGTSAPASSGLPDGVRSRHGGGGGTKHGVASSSNNDGGKGSTGIDSGNRKMDQIVTGAISTSRLPANIRTALRTAVGVVTRYCTVLYPVFGHYVLADDRLWRLTRTIPPFSSVVLSGLQFNIENTMILMSGAAGGYKDHRGALHAAHTAGVSSSALVSGSGAGGSGGDMSSGNGSVGSGLGGNVAIGSGGAGASGSGVAAARQLQPGSVPTTAASRALDVGDDMAESYYLDSQSDAAGAGSNPGSRSADIASVLLAATIRQTAAHYPPERQVYVDLLATYARNVPRAQAFWEVTDSRRLIDSLVQNVLHVDQPLAAVSRRCLLDMLDPSKFLPTTTASSGDDQASTSSKASIFTTKAERLDGIKQAVIRATQLLRATDERFGEILAGGIFSQDARSCISFAQPGDSLSDALGSLTYDLPIIGAGGSSGFRRFAHMASLSTASNGSNAGMLLDEISMWRRGGGGAATAVGGGDVADLRGDGGSFSAPGADDDDNGDSDIGAEPSSAAVAAAAAALDTKAARLRTSIQRTSESASHVLNGGFLHFYLDLINYLEMSLYEYLVETGFPYKDRSLAADSEKPVSIGLDHEIVNTISDQARSTSSRRGGEDASAGGPHGLTAENGYQEAAIGGYSLPEWMRLVCAVEANGVALLCSSSVRVRRLAVNVLYQAGIVRRIFVVSEPQPPKGSGWVFRGSQCAYDILNVPVPAKPQSLEKEFCDEPFGESAKNFESSYAKAQPATQPLGRMAASIRDEDMCVWDQHFPAFVRRVSSMAPETMLVARTLVCQRLNQMQSLMRQYAEMSIRSTNLGAACCSAGSMAFLRLGTAVPHDKAAAAVFRPDFVMAFGRLLLFAVVSLPSDDAVAAITAANASSGANLASGISANGGVGGGIYDNDAGALGISNSSSSGGGGGGRSRLAKSIARKLAPLKSSSRSSKQEQGIGLTTVAQLVRIAGVALRSDNAPLRCVTAYALSNTPATHLRALMHELRPLAESLFDDAPALAAHRNYLHVAGAEPGISALSGSPAAAAAAAASSPASESASDAAESFHARRPRSFDSSALGHTHGNAVALAAAAASAAAAAAAAGAGAGSTSQSRRRLLRQSLAQIYKHIARQLHTTDASGHRLWHDDNAVAQLVSYVRETKTVLADSAVLSDSEHQALRIHFSGLVETLYNSIAAAAAGGGHEARSAAASFTHETRSGVYQLLERWCGLGRYAESTREAQLRMVGVAVDQIKSSNDRARVAATIDEDWFLLNIAAMRAMAVLCRAAPRPDAAALADPGGPREKLTLFMWVSDALNHPDPRVQRVGQRAVQWTVAAAPDDTAMVRVLIQLAYGISVVSSVNNGFAAATPSTKARQTSGLGLVLGSQQQQHQQQQPPPASAAATAAPLTLSTDRIALGYLSALSAALAHNAGRTLSVAYTALLLPLVMFQLQSERHKIRRQALLILRVLCTHMSVENCLTMVDRIGPSIVSDIPAIASAAAIRLTEAVADAFCAHSSDVLLEVVRQIHTQSTYGGRFSALQIIVRPWLAKISLKVAAVPPGPSTPCEFSLHPAPLAHGSLLVLRCMLYMTVKADLGSLADMQGLWLALVDHHRREDNRADTDLANIWIAMRYLTGLLMRLWSPTLLGFVRRIVVFFTRSSHGSQLIRNLVQETIQPAAAMPIGEGNNNDQYNGMYVDDILAQNAEGEALPSESWASEIPFLTAQLADHSVRPLASTGALAMFYLGAISYECSDQLVQQYRSLPVLPPALFLLAHPEQWVRDAARTVLVNLVASERAHCIALTYGVRHHAASGGSRLVPLVDLSYIANDAAHAALSVLRSDECAAGFGNVDASALRQTTAQAAASFSGHQDTTRALNDSNDFLFHGWSPTIPQPRESVQSPDGRRHAEFGAFEESAVSSSSRELDDDNRRDDGQAARKRLSGLRNSNSIDIADPSLVADVADIPAALSQPPSPNDGAANDPAVRSLDQSSGTPIDPSSLGLLSANRHALLPIIGSGGGGFKTTAAPANAGHSDASSHGSASPVIMAAMGPKRRSSATSRRSAGSEIVESAARERATLQRFVASLSRLFGGRHAGCAQEWADAAVQWAMGCPVRALAGLAQQVFSALVAEARFGGSLVITPTQQMVLRLVDRLSNVVGDPAAEIVSFAETVLAALKQTAALAARMCAEDQAIKADLLATSLVLMRTAQSASVYAIALSIFERVFPLVAHEEPEFRRLVADRTGDSSYACTCSYHYALLRGLEYAAYRDRCLLLLRATFKYHALAGAGITDSGSCLRKDHRLMPMLVLVAHVPSLIIEASITGSSRYRRPNNTPVAVQLSALEGQEQEQVASSASPHSVAPDNDSTAGSTRQGKHIQSSTKTKRRPPAPSFSANAFGSTLGLMFGGAKGGNAQQQQEEKEKAAAQPVPSSSPLPGATINSAGSPSLVSVASSLSSSSDPSVQKEALPAQKESPSRLQMFRRHRPRSASQTPKPKDADGSREDLHSADPSLAAVPETPAAEVAETTNNSSVSLRMSQSYDSVRSNISSNTADGHGDRGKASNGRMAHERFLTFLAQCSHSIVKDSGDEKREALQFLHALKCLATPPSPSSPSLADDTSPLHQQPCVSDLVRDIVRRLGYAVAEYGGQRCVAETVCILLRFLKPSTRVKVALRHIGDEQAARIFGQQYYCVPEPNSRQITGSHASGLLSDATSGYAAELKGLDVCLQLLYNVLLASSDSSSSSSSNANACNGGGADASSAQHHGTQQFLDPAMAASLRHLFDLTIVARPISDKASQVLQILLQRFDDAPQLYHHNHNYPQSALASRTRSGDYGTRSALKWYETDPDVLLSAARAALCHVVSLGVEPTTPTHSIDLDADTSETGDWTDDGTSEEPPLPQGVDVDADLDLGMDLNLNLVTTRSVSPEMPVLNIPERRLSSAGGSSSTSYSEHSSDESGDGGSNDLLAELDQFDKELDEALLCS
ncbi:Cell morphogenesis protein PAG1 [Coemansia sp. RSA 1200]|nr:Cell morphogenesis protein PAG1 [Coemansia sp. RSA 1200]